VIRAFIALELSDVLKRHISGYIAILDKKNDRIRWVRPEGMHITLKFLGDIDQKMIGPISTRLDEIMRGYDVLSLEAAGFGAFPSINKARVVWLGLKGDTDSLSDIAVSVDRACSEIGFSLEKRRFNAHITLGRLKVPSVVNLEMQTEGVNFAVNAVNLYQSELLKTGAHYTVLHSSHLAHKGER